MGSRRTENRDIRRRCPRVLGVSKRRARPGGELLEGEIVIPPDAEDPLESLLAEPGVELRHSIRVVLEAEETIAAVDQEVACENPQLRVFPMRVAYDDDLHVAKLTRSRPADSKHRR
jgi:hypothetical protein